MNAAFIVKWGHFITFKMPLKLQKLTYIMVLITMA